MEKFIDNPGISVYTGQRLSEIKRKGGNTMMFRSKNQVSQLKKVRIASRKDVD